LSLASSLVVVGCALAATAFGFSALRSHGAAVPAPGHNVVSSLWSVPVTGGRARLVLRDRGTQDAYPVYRSGGRSILIVRPTGPGTTALLEVTPDGHEQRLRSLPRLSPLAYSPRRDALAVLRGAAVFEETVSGRRLRLLAHVSPLGSSNVAWSADGTTLAFAQVVHAAANPYQQEVMVLRGRRERRFQMSGSPTELALSPHGDRLAFENANALLLLDVKTGRTNVLALNVAQPVWSPDGDTIAYGDSRGLVTLDLASGRRRLVAARAANASFAPDGRTLLYVTLSHQL
jgi:hypothetical protein